MIGALGLYRAGVANEHASRAARQAEVANELARSAIETSGNANTLKAQLSLRLARDFSSRSTSWTARSFIDEVQVTAAESGDGTREVRP